MIQGGLVVAGDRAESADEAFAALSDAQLDRCYSLAGYLLGNAADAQDATQEALARAWRARGTLRDLDAFGGWLDRIVVNACMDRMRRGRVVQFVDLEAGREMAGRDPFRDFLARDEMGRILGVLTPEQKVTVVLRFWRDLPIDQIALRMGCPAGTVKSRLHSALAALRDRLERDESEVNR